MSFAATLFDTEIGYCALAWTETGIFRFQLPEATREATRTRILRRHNGSEVVETEPPAPITAAIAGVRAHLSGSLDSLRWIPLDTTAIPEFHNAVYTVTRAIDPGSTRTYGQLAHRIGHPSAAQAVGQALGRNPIPLLIPCHRVLAADHALHGFSAPGGLTTKLNLLTIERTAGFGEPTLF
ncbi:methylated-DNA--[protein]-cysteine S-methyltransferase [Nocardia panacis]|uniref:Methylated-DNA--[protein]-cysteine S-methyltransferase n=1 Tax=Nocardia panacis TaxID=2340916 RepID=A0A3A4L2X5_9NOCA|nr:methylated-DNA--[protein]-cysteine S-methyltransferase [Nocardia panacis]RJO76723.1 methylated-DNA--[protein]-cysteine S-methyltransferase [Nocardia panacis]